VKRSLLPLAVLCVAALSACGAEQPYPGPLRLPSATIVEVNTSAPVPGQYNVRATVVDVEEPECSCPIGAVCDACLPNTVLLSDSGTPRQSSRGPEGDPNLLSVVVNVADMDEFEVGQRYTFSIQVGAAPDFWPSRIGNATLLGYAPVE
jgi:predicted small lipoprotein YifL